MMRSLANYICKNAVLNLIAMTLFLKTTPRLQQLSFSSIQLLFVKIRLESSPKLQSRDFSAQIHVIQVNNSFESITEMAS